MRKNRNLPDVKLICNNCGKQAKAIAVDVGDGWWLGLDCSCQKYSDDYRFEWPSSKNSLGPEKLEALGFEIV